MRLCFRKINLKVGRKREKLGGGGGGSCLRESGESGREA